MTLINGLYGSLSPTQVRLLHLNADQDALESGQLEVVTLANAPPYYALSHAWSDGRDVEIKSESRRIGLSRNLTACIRRLQELSAQSSGLDPPIEYVWIDAVCINQEDIHERSMQVALMGNIYSQAIRTIVWLGETDSTSIHAAWQLLVNIHTVFRRENPTATELSDIPVRMYDDRLHISSGLPPLDDDQWVHLKRLMGLRWFSRVWIIQEVVLSRQDPIIILGKYCYSWEPLGWAAAWLRKSGYMRLHQIPQQLRNVYTISNLRRAHTRWPLDALMSITQIKFNATDQRDKIYGLLGLAAECQDSLALPDELKPDYSVDTIALYQRVARFCLKRNGSLAVLTRARCLGGTELRAQRLHDLNLPSWCPDWSDFNASDLGIPTSLSWVEHSDISIPAKLGYPEQYAASACLALQLHQTELNADSGSILRLSGLRMDEVVDARRFAIDQFGVEQSNDYFDERMAQVLELVTLHIPINDILAWMSGFIQTTTARQHRLGGKDMEQTFADGAAWMHSFLLRKQHIATLFITKTGNGNLMEQIREASNGGTQEHYLALVRNYCLDRAFFVTSAGRMGIGPSNTSRSDTVSVILGGGVPYLLRRSGNNWSLVGEAYIDGLMDGEAIHACRQGVIQEEIFSLL